MYALPGAYSSLCSWLNGMHRISYAPWTSHQYRSVRTLVQKNPISGKFFGCTVGGCFVGGVVKIFNFFHQFLINMRGVLEVPRAYLTLRRIS